MGYVAILLAIVMAWSGCLNLYGPPFIREEFEAWGYSDWLRIVVGILEWVAAIALLNGPTRLIGCAIAAAILVGVLTTFFRQRAWMRLEYPAVLLALSTVVAAFAYDGYGFVFTRD